MLKNRRVKYKIKMAGTRNYSLTRCASYIGYAVQAICINFAPLLFVTFMSEFNLRVEQVALLITVTFLVQLTVDLSAVLLVKHISYRALACFSHAAASLGLVLMAVLPSVMGAMSGLILSIVIYSVGSGLIEVIISPIVESCPSDNKAAQMSLLHSFYSWGQVITVLLSTLFFAVFGLESWRVLTLLWAAVPFLNFFLFFVCPMDIREQTQKSKRLSRLFGNADFLIIMLIILCAGATEIAISQWASAYCEVGLGVSKMAGDIAGPCAFALFMGISRLGYSLLGKRLRLDLAMLISGVLCILSYLIIALSPIAEIGLLGFALCGFSVGVLWPGAFSLASEHIDGGGTMFALLSFSGDSGCTLGPTLAGFAAAFFGDSIRLGIGCSIVFPMALTIMILILCIRIKRIKHEAEK